MLSSLAISFIPTEIDRIQNHISSDALLCGWKWWNLCAKFNRIWRWCNTVSMCQIIAVLWSAMHWFLCSFQTDYHCITVMQLLWSSVPWDYRIGLCGYFYSLMRKQSFFFSTFADWGGLHPIPECPWGKWWCAAVALCLYNQFSFVLALELLSHMHRVSRPLLFCILGQVLGRKSPFPLILLPQFGGYWIEGTNHELSDKVDTEQLQPLSPNTRTKLECNTTATIYRKHFLGKVSHSVQHREKSLWPGCANFPILKTQKLSWKTCLRLCMQS